MAGRERHEEPTATPVVRVQHDDVRDSQRQDTADVREREHDVREGMLDRWERELTERAIALHMFDEADEAALGLARQQRIDAHTKRRAEAVQRHDAGIARDVERAGHPDPSSAGTSRMPSDAPAQRAIERLAVLAESSGSLAEALDAVLSIAAEAFPTAGAVTLSLTVEGRLQPVASTAGWATELDAMQLGAHVGPIVDAIAARRVVVSSDLVADQRWQLIGLLGPAGRRSAISAAIVIGETAAGALTVYAEPGASFEPQSAMTAVMLAAQASLAVGWSLERLAHRAQAEAWERALASRDEIGQAKGILMEQRDLSTDEAFALLRATSQQHNTKVRDIAAHVVAHRRLPGDLPDVTPPNSSRVS